MFNKFDTFPINILESNGYIERKSFILESQEYRVWYQGNIIQQGNNNICVFGEVINKTLYVTINSDLLSKFCETSFLFEDISLNRDRILWINANLQSSKAKQPTALSLFYHDNKLVRVAVTIDIPQVLIEFDCFNEKHKNEHNKNDIKENDIITNIQNIFKQFFI